MVFAIIIRYPKPTKYKKHKVQLIRMPQNIHLHNIMLLEAKICQGNPSVIFKTIPIYESM